MRTRATALALSTHPGPAIAVTVITVVLGTGLGLELWRLAFLGLAMLANQASVGLSNDWIDAARDRAVGRTDKPVALGQIEASTVRNAAWATAVVSIALTLPLGGLATVVQAAFIASAWSYNAALKKTQYSVVPYIVSFGLLPELVALSSDGAPPAAIWALAVGGLLGVAAHFANVLPDLEDDRATGVNGLPHRLGRRASEIVTAVAMLGASICAFAGTGFSAPSIVGLVLNIGIAVGTLALLGRPSRWQFRLIILAALVNVIVLATAGSQILARK